MWFKQNAPVTGCYTSGGRVLLFIKSEKNYSNKYITIQKCNWSKSSWRVLATKYASEFCKYLFLLVESRYLNLGRRRNRSESSWQVFALKYCTETLQIAFSHNRALSGTFRLLHRARQYELPIISYLVDNETLPNASFLYRIFLPWSQRNSVWYILTEANDIAYNYGCLHADHLLPCLHACLLQNQVVFAPKDWNPANWFFSPQNFSD